MSDMYAEMIIDLYRHPMNYGKLENPDIKAKDSNPICGDVIEIQIKLNKGKVKEVKFNGKGCAISQASASLLTEMIKGKKIDELKELDKKDILDALGIEIGPVRLKCALLPLKVLKMGIYSYLGSSTKAEE
ncbi:MAG: SUF system NifU family Fe-S cluster assembly protein [archaeon]|nr:SUF system NifU family Fe-S cluster assembly protein [archaeon]MCP8318082.1 SUF system NifU family Fe-S cluster assembly protein [archaeon]